MFLTKQAWFVVQLGRFRLNSDPQRNLLYLHVMDNRNSPHATIFDEDEQGASAHAKHNASQMKHQGGTGSVNGQLSVHCQAASTSINMLYSAACWLCLPREHTVCTNSMMRCPNPSNGPYLLPKLKQMSQGFLLRLLAACCSAA